MALINTQICHDFFYDDANDWSEHRHRQQTCSYRGTCFFSYSTQVAQRWTDDNGVEWLFVADDGFSATTRQQLSALIRACPFNDYIRVPFDWDDNFTPGYKETAAAAFKRFKTTIKKRFERYLSSSCGRDCSLAYKKDRDKVLDALSRYLKFCEVTGMTPSRRIVYKVNAKCEPTEKNKAAWRKDFAKYREEHAEELAAKRARAARAAEERKQREEERRRLSEEADKWLEQHPDKMEVIHIICGRHSIDDYPFRKPDGTSDYALGQAVRERFSCLTDAEDERYRAWGKSFVWLDKEADQPVVMTSQGIRFDVREARLLLKRWRCGKVTVGQHAGMYTIQALDDDYVKIGCHLIPIWNIEGLEKELEEIDDEA